MPPRPRLAALLLLLAASLGLKLALLRPDTLAAERSRGARAGERAAAFLAGSGLEAAVSPSDPSVVAGVAGRCSVIVMAVSAEGWQVAALDRLAGEEDQVFFVHRHRLHPRQPAAGTWWSDHRARLMRHLGFEPPDDPVFGVVQSAGCRALDIPWAALGL